MKKLTDYIERYESVITGDRNLEHLYTFKDFPVFMGCVDEAQSEDLVADMAWDICKDTGVIQLGKLVPLETLYLNQHNDGVGRVWQEHYAAFAKFLSKFEPKRVLEIGGAHDFIANNLWQITQDVDWTIIEPNPQNILSSKVKVIKGWFDNEFTLDTSIDTIVHSHVLEHVYHPLEFLRNIGGFLKKGERHIFTFPNMLPMLERKFTNCLNFEHTVFLTEEIVDHLLKTSGFNIIAKEYYGNPHSIFYATEKVDTPIQSLPIICRYDAHKKVFLEYINYHIEMVRNLNEVLDKSENSVYLFGAHVFSQTLIQFGLRTNKIVSVLDNSAIKIGKRLYGTSLFVESPKILKDKGKVNVILKAGIYNDEIRKDILENINGEVEFH
jgi:2-polyprenyl-3-methyl-5-hydroxy-6-metoxy-1,4-benzoquinol methylase